MFESWFVCHNPKNERIECYGGFNSALEADQFFQHLENASISNKSKLIKTFSFFPDIWKQQHVAHKYKRSFDTPVKFFSK